MLEQQPEFVSRDAEGVEFGSADDAMAPGQVTGESAREKGHDASLEQGAGTPSESIQGSDDDRTGALLAIPDADELVNFRA